MENLFMQGSKFLVPPCTEAQATLYKDPDM